jgi:hypothetical protein
MSLRPMAPSWGFVTTFALGLLCAASAPGVAQPKKTPAPKATAEKTDTPAPTPAPAPTGKKPKEQNFNFEGLGLNGKSRSPQLLYFLERANEELERASLEKRSFIPHMVRTIEAEAL